jgi:hypothetical protein
MPPGPSSSQVKRRRLVAACLALVVGAGIAVAVTVAVGGLGVAKKTSGSSTTASGTSGPTSTTAVRSYQVSGMHTAPFVDNCSTCTTFNFLHGGSTPGRVLTTEIWYPTYGGAGPAAGHGTLPLIVFAHGFDLLPTDYQPLIDAWVDAGYVVAAPVFPDTNANAAAPVIALSNATGSFPTSGGTPENDLVHQPADVAFVLSQLVQYDTEQQSGPFGFLFQLFDSTKIGVAGQSDGASTVAGLFYNTCCSATVHVGAVAVLSGQRSSYYSASGWFTHSGPPLLVAQGTDDACNEPANSVGLYDAAPSNASKYFLTLSGATHLEAYVRADSLEQVVARVTIDFFDIELNHRSVTAPELVAAGDTPLSQLIASATAPALAPVATWEYTAESAEDPCSINFTGPPGAASTTTSPATTAPTTTAPTALSSGA